MDVVLGYAARLAISTALNAYRQPGRGRHVTNLTALVFAAPGACLLAVAAIAASLVLGVWCCRAVGNRSETGRR